MELRNTPYLRYVNALLNWEYKTAEVGARKQTWNSVSLGLVSLELGHVLFRSHEWTLARSQVLARERVPLEREHVLFRSP